MTPHLIGPGPVKYSRELHRAVSTTAWVGAALLLGALSGRAPALGIAVVAAAGAVLVWRFAAARSSWILSFGLLILSLGLLAPRSIQGLGEASVLLFVVLRTNVLMRAGDWRWRLGAACLAVSLLWLALGLNPNVPNWATAVSGARKATLVFVALAAGTLWPDDTRHRATFLILSLLVLGGVASLAIHFGYPQLESSFSRQAGVYTGLFQGRPRLQGIYAGPFHVALLGSFLLLWCWHTYLVSRLQRWKVILPIACLATALIIFASVRTAYLTVALGLVLTPLVAPSLQSRGTRLVFMLRTAAVGLLVALVLGSGLGANSALSSIPSIGQANRDLGRLSSWSTSISLFEHSPLFGDGPGSAAATLGPSFAGRAYVTADNQFLAVLVEGGLIGALAIGGVGLACLRGRRLVFDPAMPSAAAALTLLGFCTTGNAFEAAPVSLFLAALIGLSIGTNSKGEPACLHSSP
jgi:O-antigen ligase